MAVGKRDLSPLSGFEAIELAVSSVKNFY